MLQRSDEWHELRAGRFTGSEVHKLMGVKGMGQTGDTYAFEKACDIVFGRNLEEKFVSYDMARGVELEPVAFEKFQELSFNEVNECGFFCYGDNFGASPDGIISDNGVLEIKCPKPLKLFGLIAGNQIDNEYIYQMQSEMLVTNSDYCAFFNYSIYNGHPMWHEIIIKRDQSIIDKILERVEEAVLVRDKYVELLRNNTQFQI
jgi:predicted phage-related endonuclease